MLIRSITQNAMDNKSSIQQFPSNEHPYIAFPQKKLAVLDISRFTTGEIDFQVAHQADLTSSPQITFAPNLVLVSQFARLVPLSAPLLPLVSFTGLSLLPKSLLNAETSQEHPLFNSIQVKHVQNVRI